MRQYFKKFAATGIVIAATAAVGCTTTAASDSTAVPDSDAVASDAGLDSVSGDTSGGDTASSDVGTGTDAAVSTCPQAELLLDVAKGQGAGAGYAKASISGTCTETTFTMTSNGMPFYAYVSMTPNALNTVDHSYSIPRFPAIADKTTEVPLLGVAGFTVSGLPFYGPTEGAQPAAQIYGDPVFNGLMDGCLVSAATIKGPPQALRRDEHGTRLPPQTRDHLAALRP